MKLYRISNQSLGIIFLAVVTALVHLFLSLRLGFDVMFFLNFGGYLVLLAAYYLQIPMLSNYRRLVRLAFMAFTVVSIVAWIFLGDKGWWVGIADKLVELFLLILLAFERP